IIISNNAKISAKSIHRRSLIIDDDESNILFKRDNLSYKPINDDISRSNRWSRAYRGNYFQAIPSFDFRRGIIRFIPYKKRTIPLELQKALYAHGIVGRRRK